VCLLKLFDTLRRVNFTIDYVRVSNKLGDRVTHVTVIFKVFRISVRLRWRPVCMDAVMCLIIRSTGDVVDVVSQ